jgi:PAS domain S-box-containing protein
MTDPSPASKEALHFRPEWCRVTLASIGDAVITTDTSANVTFLNPVAESLTGWMLADAAGRPLTAVFNIVNEDTRRQVESPTVRALREGVVVGLANHTLLISKDGTQRPIDDSAAPIRNEQGEIAGVVLVFRDITQRKQQEKLVEDARDYAESILETLREPFLVLDKSLRVVSANRSFYQQFQAAPEETEGRLLNDLGGGEWNIPKLRELLEEVLPQNHSLENFRVSHKFPMNGQKHLLLNARRIREPGNHSELILLAIEDITERQQAQESLEVSEVRYRRLFEAAKDGILILDTVHGKVTDANPFMAQLLGYSPEAFKGKELWQIGLLRDADSSRAMVRELQQKGYVRYENLPLETTAGRKVEVEVVANVYQEDHQPVIQCNIRDITARSQLENKTKEQAKALADLSRRKDEFLAMLSHELRNPLAPILNAVQLLRLQRDRSPLQMEAHGMIDRQVAQLARLVDDLLEVSRISTGRIHLQEERLDLRGIVQRAMEATQSQAGQKGQSVAKALPAEPLWVYGDPVRLEQVVVNLLNNASKYTDRGGHIWVGLKQEGDEAVLRVRDTGVGIAPEMLTRIFDLFAQADKSLDRSQGGLGIGLALVQSLATMHRGRVEARSTPGQGSEFIVWLPVLMSPHVPTSVPAADVPAPARALQVLVVDDNEDAAKAMAMLLRAFGHEARLAHDGVSAMQAALEYVPEVVLLDIGLPIVSGYAVAKWIREEPALKDAVLVALTGYGQESDRQLSQEAGFDHHLVKPVDFAKVQSILSEVAEQPR